MFNTIFYTIAVTVLVALALYDGHLVREGRAEKQSIKSPTAILLLLTCLAGFYILFIMPLSSTRNIAEACVAALLPIFEAANLATRRIK